MMSAPIPTVDQIVFPVFKSMAKKFNLLFYETSARFDDKITDIFINIAKLIMKEL